MDEAILQTLRGNATPLVEERVRRWRAESPENEAHYQGVALVWSATAPDPLAAAAAPVDLRRIVAEADLRRAVARRRRALPRVLALAAGIAALAVSARLLWIVQETRRPSGMYAAAAPRTVALDDGSFVRLAAGSRVDVRMGAASRTVHLTGRAFFAVAHDPVRPFIVRAGPAEARVLGTRFEVGQTDGAVRIIVVDGLVAMSTAHGEVEVPAGSMGYAAGGGVPTSERPANLRALLDWPGGLLLFQGTPLGSVAEEVGSVFGRRVAVEGDSLRATRISGSFEQESFQEVILALCETVGAVCSMTPDGATITPAKRVPPGRRGMSETPPSLLGVGRRFLAGRHQRAGAAHEKRPGSA